jgi:hypothetical protein
VRTEGALVKKMVVVGRNRENAEKEKERRGR